MQVPQWVPGERGGGGAAREAWCLPSPANHRRILMRIGLVGLLLILLLVAVLMQNVYIGGFGGLLLIVLVVLLLSGKV
jgi:hypothetical protein